MASQKQPIDPKHFPPELHKYWVRFQEARANAIRKQKVLVVVVWGCSRADKRYYDARLALQEALVQRKHVAFLSEQLVKRRQAGDVLKGERAEASKADVVVTIPRGPGSLVEMGLFLGYEKIRRKMIIAWNSEWQGFGKLVVSFSHGSGGCEALRYKGMQQITNGRCVERLVERVVAVCDRASFKPN